MLFKPTTSPHENDHPLSMESMAVMNANPIAFPSVIPTSPKALNPAPCNPLMPPTPPPEVYITRVSDERPQYPEGWEGTFEFFKQQYDLFAFRPTPVHHRGARFGSTWGLLATLVVIGIVLAYAIGATQRFFLNNVSIVINTHYPEAGTPSVSIHRSPLPSLSVTLPKIDDARYFQVAFEKRSKKQFDTFSEKELQKPQNSPNSLELPQFMDLWGNCERQGCQYLRIKVYPCTNATGNPVICAPQEEIEQILNTNYLRLIINITVPETTASTTMRPHPYVRDISLKNSFSSKVQFYFDEYVTISNPDWLQTFFSSRQSTLKMSDMIYTVDRQPRGALDNEYTKIDLYMSGIEIQEIRNRMTSLDLIGMVFAFLGAVTAVFSFLFWRLNRRWFYRMYPGWSQVTDNPWERIKDEYQKDIQETSFFVLV